MIGNELKVYDGLTPRQQLNLFRNLYYNDGNATEYGIIANAINDCFVADVVPKSEVEVWKQNRFNLYQKLECYEMARQKVAREFAKYLIDHSQDGAVMISDLPDLVVDFTKGADNGDKQ
jgi:hypothetical protein